MSWRRAAMYWLSAAVLFAVYRSEMLRPSPQRLETRPASFTAFAPAACRSIDIQRGSLSLRVERAGDEWLMRSPNRVVAQGLIAATIESLSAIPIIDVVADDASHLEQFDLAPPLIVVALETGAGARVRLRFGARNPTDTAVYAQREGDERVYLIGLDAPYHVELLLDAAVSATPS